MGTICSWVAGVLYCTGPPAPVDYNAINNQSRQNECRVQLSYCDSFRGSAYDICIRDTRAQSCR